MRSRTMHTRMKLLFVLAALAGGREADEIGRASCRERV